MFGCYAEITYNLFEKNTKMASLQLNVFGRFETLDLNASIPLNTIYDGTQKQQHIIIGLTYLPILNVVIIADVRLMHTGAENLSLVTNPDLAKLLYQRSVIFINLGID